MLNRTKRVSWMVPAVLVGVTLLPGGAGAADAEDAVISVEAVVLQIQGEALLEIMKDTGIYSLGGTPIDRLWRCVGEGRGEVVAVSQTLAAHGQEALVSSESEHEQGRGHGERGEEEEHALSVSLNAQAEIRDDNRIGIHFEFKQVLRHGGRAEAEGEEEAVHEHEKAEDRFEVATAVVLHAARPRIVGARSDGDTVHFLILSADL